jgi:hypothetical protein
MEHNMDENETDLAEGIPPPPFTVRNREHVIELLYEGLQGPFHEVTEATWERHREQIRKHAANLKP